MLTETQQYRLVKKINATLIVYDKFAESDALQVWVDALSAYPIEEIEAALTMHGKASKFPPKPADIIEIINRKYAGLWKSPDEAWAVARQLSDQHASVTTTDVIMEALDGLYGLLEDDPIACRMAFKNSYERIMIAGKASGRVPKIHFSPGFDATQRLEAANEACWVGIDQQKVSAYLEAPLTTNGLQAIVNQQAAKNDEHFDPFNDPEVVAALQKLGIKVPNAS
jgi:hypothetical protein